MDEKRYFQYLQGPKQGEVVTFDKIDEEDGLIFLTFKDGSRCEESLVIPLNQRTYSSELLAEVDSPNNLWSFREEWIGREEEKWDTAADGAKYCVVPFNPGRKNVIPLPPRPTTSRFGQISSFTTTQAPVKDNSVSAVQTQQNASNAVQQSNLSDPVHLMCEKAKKFDTEVSMNLKISLPKKSLYKIVKESFDSGGEKVIEYIIQNLDDNVIKNSLKKALLEAYEDEMSFGTVSYHPDVVEEPIVSSPTAGGEILIQELEK